jgi:hypothetical protein
VNSTAPYYVPSNETAEEVAFFWSRLKRYARLLNMEDNIPIYFKIMSEKVAER